MCSIFIYFGVACIGLLLGSYIAGMLDESSRRAARENRIKSCPNCVRIQNIREASERRRKQYKKEQKKFHRVYDPSHTGKTDNDSKHDSKRVKRSSIKEAFEAISQSERPSSMTPQFRKSGCSEFESTPLNISMPKARAESPNVESTAFSAPSTVEMLKRQWHSRHASMDFGHQNLTGLSGDIKALPSRKSSTDMRMVQEPVDDNSTTIEGHSDIFNTGDDDDSSTSSSESCSSLDQSIDLEDRFDAVKNARYVFLTLREALVNSLVIIGTGCFGFYFIEGFSFIDSWYFTTVLLTVSGLCFIRHVSSSYYRFYSHNASDCRVGIYFSLSPVSPWMFSHSPSFSS